MKEGRTYHSEITTSVLIPTAKTINTSNPQNPNTMTDNFELYDLKVTVELLSKQPSSPPHRPTNPAQVICPPNEKIYCGAKQGDHFILRGEMLHLPKDQGFSIYSLCKIRQPSIYSRIPSQITTHGFF